jgi:uncharacterized damage-inducible protein DinB
MLQTLQTAPARAAEITATLEVAAHDWRPSPNAWTCRETLAHLAAADPPFEARLARILVEDNPWLPYFGPEVARPEPHHLPLVELIGRFRAQRDQLLKFLSAVAPEAWGRPAVHETLGPTTLAQQVQNVINHDADHLGQLQALRRAWEKRAPGGRP